MVPFLACAREQHQGAATPAAYRASHAAWIARGIRRGMRYAVHDAPGEVVAYVSANRWVCDCECGAGNATDPAWGFACCFGCGAVHETVRFPPDRAEIERLLLQRPQVSTRHWFPQETVRDLAAENVAHGLPASP